MTDVVTAPAPASTPRRRAPIYALIAAWSIPALILGEFALLVAAPVAILLIGALSSARLRGLRWWAGLLAALYAAPLAIWLLNPDRAESLSKDMSPVLGALIVAASAVLIVKMHRSRRHRG